MFIAAINKTKDEDHMITVFTSDAEKKFFDKIQHLFTITTQKIGKEKTYLSIIKAIFENTSANTINEIKLPLNPEQGKDTHSHHCYSR